MEFVISFICKHCEFSNAMPHNTDDENVGALNYIRRIVSTALDVAYYEGRVHTFTVLLCQSCKRANGVLGFVYREDEELEKLSFDFEVTNEDLIKYAAGEFDDSPQGRTFEALSKIGEPDNEGTESDER